MSKPSAFIIAEAGVNHNGSLEMAKRLIEVAADAGANAVKFQTFRAEKLVSRTAPKAAYQERATGGAESQYDMIRKLELDEVAHETLIDHCERCAIEFLSTPFDVESVDVLTKRFNVTKLKVPSGEITNGPLLLKVAQAGKPVFLSTGMSTLGEIEAALGVLAFGYLCPKDQPSLAAFSMTYNSEPGQNVLQDKVTLLHCTTEYPAPFHDVNLKAMDTMRTSFGLRVGFSDHTLGITTAIAAVAREAAVIEKHFTLDRNLPGPDHKSSLNPAELKEMVRSIREVEVALGIPMKGPVPSERKNILVARRSLVANCSILKGAQFTTENLTAKRPGNGISPLSYWDYLGKRAQRDYEEDEIIL